METPLNVNRFPPAGAMTTSTVDRQTARLRATASRRRGTAAVELAFVLPLIMLLGLGLIQFGRFLEVKQILTASAREGGRQASTGLLTNTQTIQVVKDYLARAGIPTAQVTVSIQNMTTSGVDAKAAAQLDQFFLRVSLPISVVNVLPIRVLQDQSNTLTAEATWYSIKDKPYPAPPEPAID